MCFLDGSVAAKQVSGVDVIAHGAYVLSHSVSKNDIGLCLELRQVDDHTGVEEIVFFMLRLEDYNFDAFGLDTFPNAVDAPTAEIITSSFHDETVNTKDFLVALENFCDVEIFTHGVTFRNGLHDFLWYVVIVGEQSFCVFNQAVAAIGEVWFGLAVANARIQAHALNDLFDFLVIVQRHRCLAR